MAELKCMSDLSFNKSIEKYYIMYMWFISYIFILLKWLMYGCGKIPRMKCHCLGKFILHACFVWAVAMYAPEKFIYRLSFYLHH